MKTISHVLRGCAALCLIASLVVTQASAALASPPPMTRKGITPVDDKRVAKTTVTLPGTGYCDGVTIFEQPFNTTFSLGYFPNSDNESTGYSSSGTGGAGHIFIGSNPSYFEPGFLNTNTNWYPQVNNYPDGSSRFNYLVIDAYQTPNNSHGDFVYKKALNVALQPGIYELRFLMRNAQIRPSGPHEPLPKCPTVAFYPANGGNPLPSQLVTADYNATSSSAFQFDDALGSASNYNWQQVRYVIDVQSTQTGEIAITPYFDTSTNMGNDFIIDDIKFVKLIARNTAPSASTRIFAYNSTPNGQTYVNLKVNQPNPGASISSHTFLWKEGNTTIGNTFGTNQSTFPIQAFPQGVKQRTFQVFDVTPPLCISQLSDVLVDKQPDDKTITLCAAGPSQLFGPDPTQVYQWYDEAGSTLLATGPFYMANVALPVQRFLIKAVPTSTSSCNSCLSVGSGRIEVTIKPNLIYYDDFDTPTPNFDQPGTLTTTDYHYPWNGFGSVAIITNPRDYNSTWRIADNAGYTSGCHFVPAGKFLLIDAAYNPIGQDNAAWRHDFGPFISGQTDPRLSPGRAFEVRFQLRSAANNDLISCPEVKLRCGTANNPGLNRNIYATKISPSYGLSDCPSYVGTNHEDRGAFQGWTEMRYLVNIPADLDMSTQNYFSICISPVVGSRTSGAEDMQIDRVEIFDFNGSNVLPIVSKSKNFLCTPGTIALSVTNALQGNTYDLANASGQVLSSMSGNQSVVFNVNVSSSTDFYIRNATAVSSINSYPNTGYNVCQVTCEPAWVKVRVDVSNPNILSTLPNVVDQTRCGTGYVTFQVTNPIAGRDYEWMNVNGTVVSPATAPNHNVNFTTFLNANAATGNVTTFTVRLKGNPAECPALIKTVTGTANIVAMPSFTIAPGSGTAPYYSGTVISYTIMAPGTPASGQTITYEWTWGDGSTPETTRGTTAEHQFSRGGTFYVTVIATQTFANSSPSCWSGASMQMLIKQSLCGLTIPLASGSSFINNAKTGAINYASGVPCAPVYTFECLGGQPQVVPGVVSFSSIAFADTLVQDDNDYRQGVVERNPFLDGKFRLRPYATYSYSAPLDGQTSNFSAGTFALPAFDWQSSARARPDAWLTPAVAVKVSPDGEVLVERDPLGVLSTAKFSYGYADTNLPLGSSAPKPVSTHALPYLQAHNTDPRTLAFESFENLIGTCPYLYGDDFLTISCAELVLPASSVSNPAARASSLRRHTGRFAAQLAALPNDAAPGTKWQLTLKNFPLTPQVNSAGLLVKVWVYNPDDLPGVIELVDRGDDDNVVVSEPLVAVLNNGMTSRNGDWVLYSSTLQPSTAGLSSNYLLAPRVKFTSTSATSEVWIDDVRVQPADAQMTTYVYDPNTFRLLASFDDQHFGLLYQYNPEGKLIRKQVETARGVKTIQETQYNTATP